MKLFQRTKIQTNSALAATMDPMAMGAPRWWKPCSTLMGLLLYSRNTLSIHSTYLDQKKSSAVSWKLPKALLCEMAVSHLPCASPSNSGRKRHAAMTRKQ